MPIPLSEEIGFTRAAASQEGPNIELLRKSKSAGAVGDSEAVLLGCVSYDSNRAQAKSYAMSPWLSGPPSACVLESVRDAVVQGVGFSGPHVSSGRHFAFEGCSFTKGNVIGN